MKKRILFLLLILYISLKYVNGVTNNTFGERADGVDYPHRDEDELLNTQCPKNLELRWKAEVSSSIRAAPLIVDINSDGKLEIVVPSYIHYLEVLEGSDGDKMPGWPAFHNSSIHTSPLLYDIDNDGVREIALATYSGEVLFFRVSGYMMQEKLVIPQLKKERIFHKDFLPDLVNSSHPHILDDKFIEGAFLDMMPAPSVYQDIVNASTIDNQEKHKKSKKDIKLPKSMINITLLSGTERTRNLEENHALKGSEESGSGSKDNKPKDVHAAIVENDVGLEVDTDSSSKLFRRSDKPADEYKYDDNVHQNISRDEEFTKVTYASLEDYVNIDSHILCTPVIADIDNNGVLEMIVAVSYFYDNEFFDNHPEHIKEFDGFDLRKYVAGGIVVFDLKTKQVRWTTYLDESTDSGKFPAHIYASPTVVDLDGDENLDIIVGTSYGFFYALDHKGNVRDYFPLQTDEIQGAVVAADINDDGKIELVTTDTKGSVVACTSGGEKVWEARLKNPIQQGPTIGDVDGDGHTDVVVPTISGNIFVLRGKDGSVIHPYPYRTNGRVMNRILLVDLTNIGERNKGLSMVTTSTDGYLYIIDGQTSCADVVDLGETSYSMIMADNIGGRDDLDLIVTTLNGNVYCFSTPARFHPLKAWRSPDQGKNNVAVRFNREGIYVTPPSRAFRDEGGKSFWVEVEIVDRYRSLSGSQAPYNVTTTLLVPGNNKENRTIKQNQVYDRAGKYQIKLPTAEVRTKATVLVEMVDRNGLYFSDDFSLTFHMYYYILLKWLLVLPMLFMYVLFIILRPQQATSLPTYSRDKDL